MGVLEVLLDIVVVVLTLVTTVKIITKAGYSGWWIMVPVSAVILSFASVIFGVNSLVNVIRSHPVPGTTFRINTTGFDVAGVVGIMALILFVASWILFVVFGFSDWPALGRQPKSFSVADRLTVASGPTPGPRDMAPPKIQDRGWYQSGSTNNDQAYWDGQAWTARRRWDGAGWVDVPL